MSNRLELALQAIDHLHSQDPESETDTHGEAVPKELLYARRMTARYRDCCEEPTELLSLAVRSQHLCRWEKVRAEYPEGRTGYLQWRRERAIRAAELAAMCIGDAGYSGEEIERVRDIVEKRRRKKDPEVQVLEDVACLVFLEHYIRPFAAKYDDDKLVGVIVKTWGKMSEAAHSVALGIRFGEDQAGERIAGLVTRALN